MMFHLLRKFPRICGKFHWIPGKFPWHGFIFHERTYTVVRELRRPERSGRTRIRVVQQEPSSPFDSRKFPLIAVYWRKSERLCGRIALYTCSITLALAANAFIHKKHQGNFPRIQRKFPTIHWHLRKKARMWYVCSEIQSISESISLSIEFCTRNWHLTVQNKFALNKNHTKKYQITSNI